MHWLAELQRRNVIRIGGVYIVGAWLVVQVADTLLPIFHTPDWVLQALVVLLALGFIPALVFAWIFELTPEGLRRDRGTDAAAAPGVDLTARRLDLAVILLLLATIGVVIWDRSHLPAPAPSAAESAPADGAKLGPHSIAVLPFANFSPAPEDALFADGLADTLLHHLAQQRQLTVIARNSSFAYKGEGVDVRKVGAELGVASVLEGSVQRQGERVRVIAQLIETRSGSHLWSQTYDRPLADLFAIQDEIGAAVLKALRVELLGETAGTTGGSDNPQAVALFLKARADLEAMRATGARDEASFEAVRDLLREALQQDPRYLDAWIALADMQQTLAFRYGSGAQATQAIEDGYAALRQAVALQPDAPGALASLAWLLMRERRVAEALAVGLTLLERSPNDVQQMRLVGLLLLVRMRPEEALAWQRRALALDPHSSGGALRQIGLSLLALGRYDEAREHAAAALDSFPRLYALYADLAWLEAAGLGRWEESTRWLLRGVEAVPGEPEALGTVADLAATLGLHEVAEEWARRHALEAPAARQATLRSRLLVAAGRTEEALAQWRVSREPGDEQWAADGRGRLAWLCWKAGDLECARTELAAGLAELGSGVEGIDVFDQAVDLRRAAMLGLVAMRLGQAGRGERLLRAALALTRSQVGISFQAIPRGLGEAELHAALGERDAVLAALEASLPADPDAVWLDTITGASPRQSPFFEGLAGDPRFEKVMDEIERRRVRVAAKVEKLLDAVEMPNP